jgi:ankyrin repeat protein
VNILIEHKADVNHANYAGFTALITACFTIQVECVKVLLQAENIDLFAQLNQDIEPIGVLKGDTALDISRRQLGNPTQVVNSLSQPTQDVGTLSAEKNKIFAYCFSLDGKTMKITNYLKRITFELFPKSNDVTVDVRVREFDMNENKFIGPVLFKSEKRTFSSDASLFEVDITSELKLDLDKSYTVYLYCHKGSSNVSYANFTDTRITSQKSLSALMMMYLLILTKYQ